MLGLLGLCVCLCSLVLILILICWIVGMDSVCCCILCVIRGIWLWLRFCLSLVWI